MIPRSWRWLLPVTGALGCGGAAPLLHPAHPEPEGTVTAGAGVAGQLLVGNAATALQQARENSPDGAVPPASAASDYRRGALAVASLAPGLSPWIGGRVGLGRGNEAGLTYTARSLRIDGRHAFHNESWALSLGIGGQALLARRGDEPGESLRGLDLGGVRGYGLDVPVIGGWRSQAGLFSLWAGVRAGYERQGGKIRLTQPQEPQTELDWTAGRWWGGGLVGLTAGFRHVFVSLELDATYHSATATAGDTPIELKGLTLAPAGALVGRF